ncbi:MAG: Sulfate adenylyltransferase subunit 1, partial [uncultured Friedmanniella sp.]
GHGSHHDRPPTPGRRRTPPDAAPPRHGRLGGRRQVDPGRPAAVRHQLGADRHPRPRRAGQPPQGAGPGRPGAAHRRPASRAGAGHHHRRGLPLLPHPGPEVHPRRLPWARAVHPEHRHRLLNRRRDRPPRRRPQGSGRADPPAPGRGVPAAGAARGAGGEQDRPGRLLRGRLHPDRDRLRPAGPQPRPGRHPLHPGLGDRGRQRGDPLAPDALVRRADGAGLPGDRGRHPAGRRCRLPLPRPAGQPAAGGGAGTLGGVRTAGRRRLPRLRRQDRVRPDPRRRRGRGAAPRLPRQGGGGRHPGRSARRRRRRAVGHPASRHRHRRLARRHPGRHRRPTRPGPRADRHRLLAGRADAERGRPRPDPARHRPDQGHRPLHRRRAGPGLRLRRHAELAAGHGAGSQRHRTGPDRARDAPADRLLPGAPGHRRVHRRRRGRRLDAGSRHGGQHRHPRGNGPAPRPHHNRRRPRRHHREEI